MPGGAPGPAEGPTEGLTEAQLGAWVRGWMRPLLRAYPAEASLRTPLLAWLWPSGGIGPTEAQMRDIGPTEAQQREWPHWGPAEGMAPLRPS